MSILFTEQAWEDYLYWQKTDRKILKKINELIKDITRTTYSGLGKPEPLRFAFQGCWSRRIDDEHRLVYEYVNSAPRIVACRYHY